MLGLRERPGYSAERVGGERERSNLLFVATGSGRELCPEAATGSVADPATSRAGHTDATTTRASHAYPAANIEGDAYPAPDHEQATADNENYAFAVAFQETVAGRDR